VFIFVVYFLIDSLRKRLHNANMAKYDACKINVGIIVLVRI